MATTIDRSAAHAAERLHELVKPGDTVYCVLRHVSTSGMQRRISLFVMAEDQGRIRPWEIDYLVSDLCGIRVHRDGGLVVNGCGMDMGWHTVHNLSARLYPDGFGCVGDRYRCHSSDHSNGDRDYTPHNPFRVVPDRETPAEITCAMCGRGTPSIFANKSRSSHTCEEHAYGAHWHKNGGYALTARWL